MNWNLYFDSCKIQLTNFDVINAIPKCANILSFSQNFPTLLSSRNM